MGLNFKIKVGDKLIHFTTERINRILNAKIVDYTYDPKINYASKLPTVKHKTVMSKMIHTMHYTKLQPTAFEMATKQMINNLVNSVHRSIIGNISK